MVNKPKKILIIRTDRLGDIIISTPVISNLRKCFPDAHIAFMCRPYVKDVLGKNPYLDEVIVYDKYGKHKSFWGSFKFLLQLRKFFFDWAIILHPTNRVHWIVFLSRIKLRAGWNEKMGCLLNKKIKHNKQKGEKHELEYTLDILRSLSIPIVDKRTYFPVTEEAVTNIRKMLKACSIEANQKIIVIHPSASCVSKRWPLEHFFQLIKLLNANLPHRLIIISSLEEKGMLDKLVDNSSVIDLRGKCTISEIGALIKRSDLFISNDSGPVHIAASLNIPVISIFGRSDPGLSPLRWGPLGLNSAYLHKPADCPRCLAHNCKKNFECLFAIKPEEVYSLACRMILSPAN